MDFNVDKMLHNIIIEKQWVQTTKDLIKLNGFKYTINKLLKIAEEVNDEYYKTKGSIPKRFFKGNLKISDIADEYGIKPLKRKIRFCPFHEDKSPSLSLSNEKGLFNCFGCGAKGNLIKFKAMLDVVKKNGNN